MSSAEVADRGVDRRAELGPVERSPVAGVDDANVQVPQTLERRPEPDRILPQPSLAST